MHVPTLKMISVWIPLYAWNRRGPVRIQTTTPSIFKIEKVPETM